jgi:hypothetical protein
MINIRSTTPRRKKGIMRAYKLYDPYFIETIEFKFLTVLHFHVGLFWIGSTQ